MKLRFSLILAVFLLLSPCVLSDISSADDTCYLRLSAVYPTSSSEGFALTNYGTVSINLVDYRVSDGEGTVTFSEDILIQPNSTMYILKGEPPVWLDGIDYRVYGNNGITAKKFTLSDNGDDLYLYKGDTLIDSFVYGNITSSVNGWNGDPVDKIPKNKIAERCSYVDSDSKNDWDINNHLKIHDTPEEGFSADVIPFTFPESKGEQILSELCNAKTSVDISVYLINHPDVIAVLDHLLSSGITVRILAEGSPVGGISDDELGLLTALYRHGADIRLIHSGDSGKRFTYLHNKYAVIDGSSVIITTENWQKTSFESNRGWGAIIRSQGFAEYMGDIFEEDFSGYDTDSLYDLYPKIKPYSIDGFVSVTSSYSAYPCTVYPVLSPDNSLDSLKDFIYSAEENIFVQQLEVDTDWLDEEDNPLSWLMERSFEGVDCRLMVSSTFDDLSDEEGGEYLQTELENYDLKCRLYEGSGLLHNKGLIADDCVWLGSVNWTDNSLNYNRETAVIIDSADIADYFSTYFCEDWGDDENEDISINVVYQKLVISGETVLLDASGTKASSSASYLWDLDCDGVFERTGKKIPVIFGTGLNTVSLRVVSGDNVCEESFEIYSADRTESIEIPWKYIPFILLCTVIIIVTVFVNRGKDDRQRIRQK